MSVKHKLLSDFQFVTSDKKIVILKAGTILDEYNYTLKGSRDSIKIDRDIVDNNAEYFQNIDWKAEFLSVLKQNKIAQPSQVLKKIVPFIEETFILNKPDVDKVDTEYHAYINAKNTIQELNDEIEKLKKQIKSPKNSDNTELQLENIELKEKLNKIVVKESNFQKGLDKVRKSILEFMGSPKFHSIDGGSPLRKILSDIIEIDKIK